MLKEDCVDGLGSRHHSLLVWCQNIVESLAFDPICSTKYHNFFHDALDRWSGVVDVVLD